MKLRRAAARDLDGLCELWAALSEHHAAREPLFDLRPGAQPEIRRLLEAQLRDPDQLCLICQEPGGPPLAFCLVRIDRAPPIHPEVERGEITDLWVRPTARRRGLATSLVDAAHAWLHGRGVGRVEVRVVASNPEGRAFWRARGYGELLQVLHRRLRP